MNIGIRRCLVTAIKAGNEEGIRILLKDHPTTIKEYDIWLAISNGHNSIARLLRDTKELGWL